MREVLQPRTDAGVLAQVVSVAGLYGFGLYRTWRHRDLRWFLTGAFVFVLGLMALRAAH